MPDLTPHTQPIATAIYATYEADADDWRRDHLGASVVGNPCDRAVWYTFRWAKKPDFPGRVLRLFARGQMEEPRVVADLERIGITVEEVDPATGKQWRVAVGQHFGGSLDGIARGVPGGGDKPHVLEIKTHNRKSFDKLRREGVTKSKPQHYVQMQVYMHLSDIDRALYVAVCKDDESIYTERVRGDREFAQAQIDRAKHIIDAPSPPQGIKGNPADYRCKWCPFWSLCYDQKPRPEVNCRTCVRSTPEPHGWTCSASEDIDTHMRTGCVRHLYHPDVLNQRPVDADKDTIYYADWVNGVGGRTSEEYRDSVNS